MGEGAAAGSRWERRASLAAAAVLALVALVEIDTARSLSVTCDEVSYLSSGYSYVARGAILMGPTHPPLAKLLGGATLRALGARGEWPSELDARPTDDWRPEWVYGERLLFADNSDFTFPGCARGADALVVAARLPNLVFPLLVAAIVYAWSRDRFGSWGGLVSLVLTATYPDLLGHGALVCSDVPLAAFALAAGFCVERLASGGGAAWLGALGLALGGALVSKATGVFVGPALLVVVLALLVRPPEALVNGPLGKLVTGPVAARVVRASLAGAVVCGVVLVVVWAAYLGANPVERYAHMLEHLRTHIPTRPSGYLLGLMGHRVWWFYLLVAVTLKLPLGTLALLGATALAARDARARGSWVREAVIHLPPLVIFVVLSLRALRGGRATRSPCCPSSSCPREGSLPGRTVRRGAAGSSPSRSPSPSSRPSSTTPITRAAPTRSSARPCTLTRRSTGRTRTGVAASRVWRRGSARPLPGRSSSWPSRPDRTASRPIAGST